MQQKIIEALLIEKFFDYQNSALAATLFVLLEL